MAETKVEKFDPSTLGEYERELYRDYSEDLRAHDDAIINYDAYEAMHNGQTYDAVSKETSNGLTDSKTATIYLERAARVAGQLPDGEVIALGKKDKGKALFMDILLQKWIYPNANAQRSFRTKMFMLQYGSSEYGWMPIHYDLNVSPNGYFGPDCWLWNPRMFIPQSGFTSIADMDYVHALANKSGRFFEDILDEPDDAGWEKGTIRELLPQLKRGTKSTNTERDTLEVRNRQTQDVRQVTIATRYEAGKDGRWVSFLPDFGYRVIRDIPNPHKNGRIPFVIKPCIPTFDSFYNIGDFQRSMPMQFANDGLDNFYFQGIKINLFPPKVINANGVIRHTMSNEAGAVWEVNGNVNDVKVLETSTAGLNTYQAAKGMAQGAIQAIAGTTDTRANAESSMDPGFGKTPEALRMLQERESTRDNQDRELLEEAMGELIDGMLSLIPTMKEKIPVDLFAAEIDDITAAGHDDLLDIFKMAEQKELATFRASESEEQLRIKINPAKLQGLEYRFQLEPNSTMKKNKEAQLSSMIDFLGFVGKMPNALQQFQEATGKVPNWQHVFSQFGSLADVPGMDEMFMDAPAPPQVGMDGMGQSGGPTPGTAAPDGPPQASMTPEMPAQMPAPAPAPPRVNPMTGMPYVNPQAAQGVERLEAIRAQL